MYSPGEIHLMMTTMTMIICVQTASNHSDSQARSTPHNAPEIRAVELARGSEHDRLRGHVDAHGERLRREEALHERLLKEDLNHLLQDGQQPAVVDTDATPQQRQQRDDLRRTKRNDTGEAKAGQIESNQIKSN